MISASEQMRVVIIAELSRDMELLRNVCAKDKVEILHEKGWRPKEYGLDTQLKQKILMLQNIADACVYPIGIQPSKLVSDGWHKVSGLKVIAPDPDFKTVSKPTSSSDFDDITNHMYQEQVNLSQKPSAYLENALIDETEEYKVKTLLKPITTYSDIFYLGLLVCGFCFGLILVCFLLWGQKL